MTVTSVAYPSGSSNDPALTEVAELPVGGEPWQVIIDGCDSTAYVVLRKDQKVVEITGLKTTPAVGRTVSVGSEPTSLALTPNQTALYVSNWVDGNLTVINPAAMTVKSTVDLNAVIAATGFLGPDVMTTPRPGLAHPRGIAVTNNGDASDADETVYVTEWFAVRTSPEQAQANFGPNSTTAYAADTNWKGLLYAVPVSGGAPSTIDLPPVLNTGFNDAHGNVTGCFPNQVASVTIETENTGTYAYVTSTCASPAGPVGVFQFGACQVNGNCTAFNGGNSTCDLTKGVCTSSCTSDAQCGSPTVTGSCVIPAGGAAGECTPVAANAKTTTHPGLTIVTLGSTPTAQTTNLDAPFTNTVTPTSRAVEQFASASTRMPLLPTDVDFKPGFAYVPAEGADGVFRLSVAAGKITAVGSTLAPFIDLHLGSPAPIRMPIGIAINQSATSPTAFVANDGTRSVVAINLATQAVSQAATAELAVSPLPTAGTPAASVLNGKRFFTTGLGRWSLNGAAWGSCAACHVDGLTDNVTWYFARGPRQSTSLDGTFGKGAGSVDQRILNWTAVNDEIADFETNVRGISGGVGAIVTQVSNPISNADRLNLVSSSPPNTGLEGSSAAAALLNTTAASTNWGDITNYVAQIRSPRAISPSLLNQADVTAGAALFAAATCNGCHSGQKWTISTVFYTPASSTTGPTDGFSAAPPATSLSATSWLAVATAGTKPFPVSLYPSTTAGKQTMRSGAPTGFEQLQCILRPVGTIAKASAGATFPTIPTGVSPAAVNVLELRQDMGNPLGAAGGGQGSGTQGANDFTFGFNIPSLLGVQVGAPFFHAGNARSLEEMFNNAIFQSHYQALGAVFTPTPQTVQQMVAYLLSVDGNTTAIPLPAGPSNEGGDICHYP